MPEGYELTAEVWLDSNERMADDQVAVLREGAILFPRRIELLLRPNVIHARRPGTGWHLSTSFEREPGWLAQDREPASFGHPIQGTCT